MEITEAGEKKDLSSQQVKLFARKSDGKIVEQTTGISITNATNGQVTIDLLNAAVQVPGYVYFELEISDDGGTISTANFIYKVISKVGSDEAIESTNEVATLKKIEEYVAQAKVELQNFKKLQTSMLETNNSINSQEALRVEAESLRVVSEEGRVAAETKREEAFKKFEG
ncbi:BppU family phage baseplate upper protein, partial [Clostridium perfringens]